MKISDVANSFFQWPAISFPYVEFPSILSQQTFVLGVSSSQRRSYGLMQLEYRSRKPILSSDLFSIICSIAVARSVDSSVDDLACLRRHTDETPARFSNLLLSGGESRYKAPLSFVDKGSKAKSACAASPWQLDVLVSNFTGSAEWSSRMSSDETKVCVELP